ncbi:MAG: hypothetical protein RPU43_13530 [Candidatus Sedimenticola sp. (ex Thyasira tokunagai)]
MAVYAAMSVGGEIADIQKTVDALMSEKGLFIALSPIIILVANGLVSADWKARLIFWKYSNPLPGSEAFSKHINNDPRIDVDFLQKHWGALPSDPAEQNRLWYKMYRSVEADVRVHEAHYDWLFTRDLAAFAVVFLLVFSVIGFLSISNQTTYLYYFMALIAQYLLVVISSRTYGKRFVSSVLACASQGLNQ